ncbi:MAG: pantoate--beta-alanine ligase [Chloroflexi bacterium]|jgi:pantoate--beta-alanine ligase|nr:pantoate--beta-alanine ligase [Chloroflexota bacterium]
MKIAKTIAELKESRRQLQGSVGFVPTMGFLHEGHLSLVRQARAENASVIASIFVNPTQFGPNDDFSAYPRDTERDLALLKKESTDIVFMPEPPEMYPPNARSWVVVDGLTDGLEGGSRPGHFRGVTTIVTKLFNIVEPTRSYFGQKDVQQALVIQKMAQDLNMNLEVIICPTVRETDGLAMSSRNVYLVPEERQAALVLFQSLNLAQQLYSNGERSAERIRREMITLIEHEPRAEIDYVSIADTATLKELDKIGEKALVSLAVKVGKPRLLDNIVLGELI